MTYSGFTSGPSIVAFLACFGSFGPEIPLHGFWSPDSTGVVCVNSSFFVLDFVVTPSSVLGVHLVTTTIPNDPSVAGAAVVQQAIELNGPNGHASPCGRQVF